MQPTFFTHNEIVDVISDVNPFSNFLLNFFGQEYLSPDEQINFDKIADDKRIAVFVNPRIPGEVIKQRGYQVNSYKPGYIKDKRTIDPKHVFKRRAGQPMNSAMSPSDRYAATVIDLSIIQVTALYRRLELMAAQLLLNGTYDMIGDGINVNIDFARNADNTIALAGANTWTSTNSAVSPIDDIDEWLTRVTAPVTSIVFGKHAWKAFRKDPKFKDQVSIEATLGMQNLTQMPQQNGMQDVVYRGELTGAGGVRLYTYTGTYEDPKSGLETLFVPDDAVMLLPDGSKGYQCYSPIWDSEANFETLPYFMKNWSEKDPGLPYLLLQSSPMLAHAKINSTLAARTGADGT